jgi:hypothetical protein
MCAHTSRRSAPAQNTFWSERICNTVQGGPPATSSSFASNALTHSSLIAFTGDWLSVRTVTAPLVLVTIMPGLVIPAP